MSERQWQFTNAKCGYNNWLFICLFRFYPKLLKTKFKYMKRAIRKYIPEDGAVKNQLFIIINQ